MKRLAIAVVALALVVVLAAYGPSVRAQAVASIALPDPGGTEQLNAGCNNISLTFPDGTASDTVAQAVTPAGALEAMWRYDATLKTWEGYSPAAPPAASDLPTVDFLDSVWLCVTGGPSAAPTPQTQTAITTEPGLYIVRPDGGGLRQLVRSPQYGFALGGWSPDGKHIAILAGTCSDTARLIAEPDSGSIEELPAFFNGFGPWAPDGQRLLVIHWDEESGLAHVFVLEVGSPGEPQELFQFQGGGGLEWSPDGGSVAYLEEAIPGQGRKLKVLTLADGATTTVDESVEQPLGLAWAPDGKRLAYSTGDGVFVVDADGGSRVAVASGGSGPQWMPDGQRLIFHGPEGIALVSPSGGPIQVLSTGRGFDVSSDGRFVAVYDYLEDGGPEIKVFDLVAGGSRVVSGDLSPVGHRSFSPDGRRLLFLAHEEEPTGGPSELYVVNVDGTGLRKLWQPALRNPDAEWSPDGRFILLRETDFFGCGD